MQEKYEFSQAGNNWDRDFESVTSAADVTSADEASADEASADEASADEASTDEASTEIRDQKLTSAEKRIKAISDSPRTKLHKFNLFDSLIKSGLKRYIEMGLSLDEINHYELWKEAEYKSWNGYCKNLCGISKSHANRLIVSAKIAVYLTKQNLVEPCSESQVRPLAKLEESAQKADAWRQAVKIANGQPTQKNVADVVREMIGTPESKSSKKPNLREIVKRVVNRIRIVIDEGRSSDEIKTLLNEIEEAVKFKSIGEA